VCNAFFLIFLITIQSLTIFSIDYKQVNSRLGSSFTLLLTSVSFKWVVNRSLPTVAYLTGLDRYAITCIIYLSLLAAWHSNFWLDINAKYGKKISSLIIYLFL
jgi:hypothetical protein